MTPERWAEVKAAFNAVIGRPAHEREEEIVRQCRGDSELLAEVRALVESHESADGFLERNDSGDVTLAIGSGSADAAWVLACPECGASWPGGTIVCPHDGEPLEEDARRLVGHTLEGTYELEELVGQGGFGVVFRAQHLLLGERVAIKILRRELAASPEVVRRFVREGRVARSIRHENVVAISDLRSSKYGLVFLVMEFLEGRTLRDELNRVRRLPLDDVVSIVEQIASGLDAAHALGVVHRDLKPENVMLDGETGGLRAKICDLGLAVLVGGEDEAGGAGLTVPGQQLGSPKYMSPEQWGVAPNDGEPRIDRRTDVYSLGVLAAEAIAGASPFDGEDVWAIRDAHLAKQRSVSRLVSDGVSMDVARVLERAVALHRSDRFASAGEFSEALRAASAGQHRQLRGPLTESERRHLVPAVGLVLLTGMVAFGSVLWLWKPAAHVPAPSPPAPSRAMAIRPYAEMSESERIAFVEDRARAVSLQLDKREYRFPPDVRQAIKRAVERYVARLGTKEKGIGKDDIAEVLGRGRRYAPGLAATFEAEGLPVILGLYLPMIESEFREDAVSSMGARGMFQMMPSTAATYGVPEKDLDSAERCGPVAARHLRERFEEFSGDRMGIVLGLVAYNMGSKDVRRYLAEVVALDDEEAEMRFWAMAGNSGFDSLDNRETPKYVTTFFAAAIVGENPAAFGIPGPGLTAAAGR